MDPNALLMMPFVNSNNWSINSALKWDCGLALTALKIEGVEVTSQAIVTTIIEALRVTKKLEAYKYCT